MENNQIAFLHYSAPPIIGGVESVLKHQARHLASAGYAVRVIAGRGGVFDRRVNFVSIPLVDSQHSRVLGVKKQLDQGKVPDNFERLVADISEKLAHAVSDVDVLIAHNVASLHKNLALTAALHKLAATPGSPRMILWNHDLAWTSARYRGELYEGYPWDLLRNAWPGVRLVAPSIVRRDQLVDLMRVTKEQVDVVPDGITPTQFLKIGRPAIDLVERLGLWGKGPVLLLPVRITRRKNIELALHVLAELCKRLPQTCLIITGPLGAHNQDNQAYFDQLKGLRAELGLGERAIFLYEQVTGFIPDETIADFYRLADALLMPSREEGFGLPMLEAGLGGLPIFCADIPALRELGGADANYFSPDADALQVAQLIEHVLASSPIYRMRTRVRNEYSWPAIIQKRIIPLLETWK